MLTYPDETERVFTPPERRIAILLVFEGKAVKALKENPTGGRVADAEVDGVEIEFKSLEPGATSATVRNSVNNSLRNGGQARQMIVDAHGSGLTEADARQGALRVTGISRGKLDGLRIIGDGFDFQMQYPQKGGEDG